MIEEDERRGGCLTYQPEALMHFVFTVYIFRPHEPRHDLGRRHRPDMESRMTWDVVDLPRPLLCRVSQESVEWRVVFCIRDETHSDAQLAVTCVAETGRSQFCPTFSTVSNGSGGQHKPGSTRPLSGPCITPQALGDVSSLVPHTT